VRPSWANAWPTGFDFAFTFKSEIGAGEAWLGDGFSEAIGLESPSFGRVCANAARRPTVAKRQKAASCGPWAKRGGGRLLLSV
jgi:hypothetical protein